MLQDALELANAAKKNPDVPRSERKVIALPSNIIPEQIYMFVCSINHLCWRCVCWGGGFASTMFVTAFDLETLSETCMFFPVQNPKSKSKPRPEKLKHPLI